MKNIKKSFQNTRKRGCVIYYLKIGMWEEGFFLFMQYYTYFTADICALRLTESDGHLTGAAFVAASVLAGLEAGAVKETPLLREAKRQLREYFAGSRSRFDLPLAPAGTLFQRRVWEELQKIPYGETISYGTLAARIGNPKAGRAVGMANHRNPIAIIIPCHRVIGADGSLTGYGGGLPLKEKLLALEAGKKEGVR